MPNNKGYDSTNDSTNTTIPTVTNGIGDYQSGGGGGVDYLNGDTQQSGPPPPFSNKSAPIGESLNSVDDDQTLIIGTQTYFADEVVLIPDVDKVIHRNYCKC